MANGRIGFLGIGAQKAGTTWLYSQLKQHPEIDFPLGKEVHFWNKPHRPDQVEAYLKKFSHDHRRQGEITPAYAMLPLPIIETIHRCNPDLQLIYMIRNPIDRAWSSALMALGRAELAIHEASDQWFIDHFRSAGSLARGDYEGCLRTWRQVFAPEQALVLRFEDINEAPERLLNECFRFLCVEQIENEMLREWGCRDRVFAGPRHAIRPSLLAVLRELYQTRIESLAAYLDQDLGAWLA
jgi:Sulfotransferase domain